MQKLIDLGYTARPQFYPLHDRTERWAAVVAHRRAGKTVACVNELIASCCECTKPNPRFAYVAPYFSQAKDVAWSYLKHYTAPIPSSSANESELRVDLPGSRRIRLYGADNYERLRGLYFDGVVLDEYGDMDPRAWTEVIRPALSDRLGWAIFIGTPKGQNHFADLWRAAQADEAWLTYRLRASETGLIPQAELDSARHQMSEEQYAAEFECSFEASVVGTVFGKQMEQADKDGRICSVPWQPEFAVNTWWDLGSSDATAIWFTQDVGREVHVIDYYENAGAGVGVDHYVTHLSRMPYVWGKHYGPHDIEAKSFAAGGRSTLEVAAGLGFHFEVVPRVAHKHDAISAGRVFMQRCWFDRAKTERGRLALTSYHYQWDEKRKVFSTEPVHDWASDPADAFMTLACGHRTMAAKEYVRKPPEYRPMPAGSQDLSWMAM
jgi:phage terminase large subunit